MRTVRHPLVRGWTTPVSGSPVDATESTPAPERTAGGLRPELQDIGGTRTDHGVVIIETPAARRWTGLHVLLSVQSLLIVLVSINRLSALTTGYVAANQFLRWVDLNNMVLGLFAVLVYHLLVRYLERRSGGTPTVLGVVFVIGAYLYAASYGSHEVTNYLHVRFCPDTTSDLCRIVAFNDDQFSHLLFFAGFIVLNLVVMLTQALSPDPGRSSRGDNVLIVVNALFVAAGVVANLAFEEIGLDLYVVAAVAVFALVLLWRQPRQLILRYYTVAFVLGLVVTVVVKALR
jgi:hypothetical protein